MKRTTRAAIFHGADRPFEFVEVPIPDLRGAEILVEVIACTLCGSDFHSVRGRRAVPVPTILGHETLGRVVEFGPDTPRLDAAGRPLKLGDRVTWAIVASCGNCFYCRHELPQKCDHQVKYGHERIQPVRELTGGLAGHCVLAAGSAVFLVPEHVPDQTACPANCAGATVAAALEAAGPLEGRNVLVIGAGMLGMTAIAWSIAMEAERVIVTDVDPARLDLASSFGATDRTRPGMVEEVALGISEGRGVDVVLELSGSPDAVEASIPLLRMGGSMILVGSVFPSRSVSIEPEQIVRRCLTLRGVHNYGSHHLKAALDFLGSEHGRPFEALVTPWQPLEGVDRAFSMTMPPGHLRIGVRPTDV